jgi:Protein of unknown function (DUF1570)
LIAQYWRSFLVCCGMVLSLAEAARADLLYFQKGGMAQLPCKREGKTVDVDAPGGRLQFLATDFRAIVPEAEPASEWPTRLSSARKGDATERLAAAWWALENGLTAEAVAALRDAHSADPNHEPTASLAKTLDAVSPPLEDPETHDLNDALRGTFQTARSPHFVLRHQLDPTEAQARLDLLEKVYTSYYLTLAAQGIRLSPPGRRLLAVVYRSKEDYIEFLRRENAGAFLSTQGYFHPTRNMMVAFDGRQRPEQRTSAAAVETRRGELARLRPNIERLPSNARLRVEVRGESPQSLGRAAATAWLAAQEREVARQTLLLDLERLSIDLGIAAHETIHQLVANSGFSARFDDLPTWLHEGLAAQFEVIRGGRWAGVGRAHDLRLPDWRAIHPAPRLATLVRDEGFGQGYRKDLYAEAWALVYFLRKRHPASFTRFLDLLRAPSPDRNRTERLVDLFRTSFGSDWPALESEWHQFMRSVTTPLEAGATRASDSRH